MAEKRSPWHADALSRDLPPCPLCGVGRGAACISGEGVRHAHAVREMLAAGTLPPGPVPTLGRPRGWKLKPNHELRSRYRTSGGRKAHTTIVEQRIGMKLPPGTIVHHVDPDDKLTNAGLFVVCPDQTYHGIIERRGRALRECGNANWLRCRECHQWDDPANLRIWEDTTRPGQFKQSHYRWKGQCVNKGERCDIRRPHRKPAIWRRPERFAEAGRLPLGDKR